VKGVSAEQVSVELGADSTVKEFVGTGAARVEVFHREGSPIDLEISRLERVESSAPQMATTAYLFRSLTDESGSLIADGKLSMDQVCGVDFDLVVAEKLQRSVLFSPLPGGVRAEGCWIRGKNGLRSLPWSRTEGGVAVELPELEPGEHHLFLKQKAIVAGDFIWPSSRLVGGDEEIKATTRESRVVIKEK